MRRIKIKFSKFDLSRGSQRGLGLIEVMVVIGMIVLFFSVIASVTYALKNFQENRFMLAASYVANASMDKMSSLPFSSLAARTNGDLTGITFNLGAWKTAVADDAPSAPNVLQLSRHHEKIGDATALIAAPSSNVSDGSFEAKIKLNGAAANSFAGLFFRSQDNFSYYRYVFNDEKIKFEKVSNGAPTTLWQETRIFSTTTFYKLKASFASSNIDLYLDDFRLNTTTDASFEKGDLGILVTDNELFPSIDNAQAISGLAFNWDFDNAASPSLPPTWKRQSLYDLPSAQGLLTINDLSDNLKKIIVTIKWVTAFGQRTLQTQTLITSY